MKDIIEEIIAEEEYKSKEAERYQSSQIFWNSSNYYFLLFGGLIWIFVYELAVQTSASQAGPKFKTVRQRVWKNNSGDFKKIWLFK